MAQNIDGLSVSVTATIAWTANETKTTEKKSGALTLAGDVPLSPRDAYVLEVVRPAGNRADALTVYVYNVSKVDGTNSADHLVSTFIAETASDASAVYRNYPVRGLFLGTENQIKIGMKFGVNQTATVKTCYVRLVRSAMA